MIKFNPIGPPFDFTGQGGGTSSPDNFSYYKVTSGRTVTIPVNQEMLFKGVLTVYGTLKNKGIVRMVKDDTQQMAFWNYIPTEQAVLVPKNRTMFFKRILRVDGILRNLGIVEAI